MFGSLYEEAQAHFRAEEWEEAREGLQRLLTYAELPAYIRAGSCTMMSSISDNYLEYARQAVDEYEKAFAIKAAPTFMPHYEEAKQMLAQAEVLHAQDLKEAEEKVERRAARRSRARDRQRLKKSSLVTVTGIEVPSNLAHPLPPRPQNPVCIPLYSCSREN